ncbi:MAG: Rnase Y domain-containing protein [Bdellovibrionales bacterium]|nr:Rnase Y domain-containing protein [Bdellovibrionales bacterium]
MLEEWWIYYLLAGVVQGVVGAFALNRLLFRHWKTQAELQAQELIQNAKDQAESQYLEIKANYEEWAQEAQKNFEIEHRKIVERNQRMDEKNSEREVTLQEQMVGKEEAFAKQEQIYRSRQGRYLSQEKSIKTQVENYKNYLVNVQNKLSERAQVSVDQVKEEMILQLENETRHSAMKMAAQFEEEAQVNLERDAKRMVRVALNRFARPYCSERGIGNIQFPSHEIQARTLGENRRFLKILEKTCGVDVSINDEYQSASVLGYDPVRRELGRLTLEKMILEKNLSETKIEELMQVAKKELFKKIILDGNRIAKELKIEGLSEEIRHMMGALRYRYSFAQNQHFHCAEVGFLCGLLASEMGVDLKSARRSGMLHDIGKAMDHSKEGGHAVIGAEFIEQHGEAPHIVHAVRAHHYDETPSTDLAYLVIAADAISGSRPGARRSTVDSYTQKIADLEKIGNSFPHVMATYILSAGREVRVLVDSDKMDDLQALDLSKKIAQKIEEECSYPGLIKLTVVRETQAVEMAR